MTYINTSNNFIDILINELFNDPLTFKDKLELSEYQVKFLQQLKPHFKQVLKFSILIHNKYFDKDNTDIQPNKNYDSLDNSLDSIDDDSYKKPQLIITPIKTQLELDTQLSIEQKQIEIKSITNEDD